MSARRALKKMGARRALKKMGARRALKQMGARRAPKNDGCSTSTPKIMGALPHFFKRAFHELISFMSILHLLNCSLFGYSSNNECLCPF